MKSRIFKIAILLTVSFFFYEISSLSQNDSTNDPWQCAGDDCDTGFVYINRDPLLTGGKHKVAIGNNYTYTDFEVFASSTDEGIRVSNGKLGLGASNTWFSWMQLYNQGGGRADMAFGTKHGFWGDQSSSIKAILTADGYFGINTLVPSNRLHVVGNSWKNCSEHKPLNGLSPGILARGGIAFGAAYNENPGSWIGTYDDANGDGVLDAIDSLSLANSSNLAFYAAMAVGCGAASGKPAMIIMGTNSQRGYVGIGTTAPQHKLDVCGKIRGSEVLVEDGWCDYVLASDYNLKSIEDQMRFIEENGHLSNFKSEKEMNGEINVGDVTKRQQKTIEEQMLYIYQLNENNKVLSAQNEALSKKYDYLLELVLELKEEIQK